MFPSLKKKIERESPFYLFWERNNKSQEATFVSTIPRSGRLSLALPWGNTEGCCVHSGWTLYGLRNCWPLHGDMYDPSHLTSPPTAETASPGASLHPSRMLLEWCLQKKATHTQREIDTHWELFSAPALEFFILANDFLPQVNWLSPQQLLQWGLWTLQFNLRGVFRWHTDHWVFEVVFGGQ